MLSDGRTTFIVPVESKSNKYIIGLERSMFELEWDGLSADVFNLNEINTVEEHYPKNRFNDGKCDPQGRLWAGKLFSELHDENVCNQKFKLSFH